MQSREAIKITLHTKNGRSIIFDKLAISSIEVYPGKFHRKLSPVELNEAVICWQNLQERIAATEKSCDAGTPDPWKHRSAGMKCRTCMFCVMKDPFLREYSQEENRGGKKVGRCRRRAPTMNGYPVIYEDDWCGDHKIDENKV
jgi:hypothetical protein